VVAGGGQGLREFCACALGEVARDRWGALEIGLGSVWGGWGCDSV